MAVQSVKGRGARTRKGEQPKQLERAHRILDAAAELIQRWGYKKTAIDDIARAAGVAKGTIYLHWKTREDLFMALLLRESIEASKVMLARIDSDPQGVYLSHIVKHSVYVIMTRPLARALFIQDVNVLGEILQSGREDLNFLSQQKLLAGRQMLEFFRAKGALRSDRDLTAQIKIHSALVMGFMMADQYLPEELHSTPAEASELLAEAVHMTLEPAEPLAPEVLRELKAAWDSYVRQYMQLVNERLQKEVE